MSARDLLVSTGEEWDFQSGANPGRGLYLLVSPESKESGDDAPAMDVEISNVGVWLVSVAALYVYAVR